MKQIFFSATALALALCVSCTDEYKPQGPDAGEGGLKTISVGINDTRIAATQGDSKLCLSWQAEDAVRVIGAASSEVYSIKAGFSAHEARFQGEEVVSDTFAVVYPSSYESVEAIGARSYVGQTQTGNGSTAHLEFNALADSLTDYSAVTFDPSADGVKVSGAMKFVLTFPDEASTLTSLTLLAPSALFYTDNAGTAKSRTLTLALADVDVTETHTLTAYMMTSWTEVDIPAGTALSVIVEGPASHYVKTVTTKSDCTVLGGRTLVLDMSAVTLTSIEGTGTESDPYLIRTKDDMNLVKSLLDHKASTSEATYFKLMNDLDMEGASWTTLTNGSDAATWYKIDFSSDTSSGARKTLSNMNIGTQGYASIFGVLNGSVHDVNFDAITVTQTGGSSPAVICGFLGAAGGQVTGEVRNVAITGSTVSLTTTAACPVGIVCGNLGRGEIDGVDIDSNSSVTHKMTVQPANGYASVGGVVGSFRDASQAHTVKNVNCAATVNCNTESACVPSNKIYYAVGGVVARTNFYISGDVIENCTFSGKINTVSNANVYHVGGIVGLAHKDVTVKDCKNTATLSVVNHYTGGIVGRAISKAEISGCTNTGAITCTGKNYIAGIAGSIEGEGSTVSNCTNTGASVTGGAKIAGIVGSDDSTPLTITGCSNSAAISNTGGHYSAGIVGYLKAGSSVSKCRNTGSVTCTASKNQMGGIVGWAEEGTTLDQCFNSGNISTNGTNVGGIVGTLSKQGSTVKSVISNCYSIGDIKVGGQCCGGILGDGGAYVCLTNCYATGYMGRVNTGNSDSGRTTACIAGRLSNCAWQASGYAHNNTVSNIIAWPNEINAGGKDANSSGGSGAIVGYTGTKNVYSNCYRRDDSDVNYVFLIKPASVDAPCNQGSSTSNITTGISTKYWYPYHGDAVSNTECATVTSVAQKIRTADADAWPDTVWDLSGDRPTLRNVPEE